MPRKATASTSTRKSPSPRQGGKVKDSSRKTVRSERTPERRKPSAARASGPEIDVPRTTRQKRLGSRPRFRTDMDFMDET